MRPECIQAVSQALGRQITQAESQKIEQKITEAQQYLWKTDRSSMLGLTKDQQFRLAADQAAKDIKIDAIKKQQQVALTIIAHDRQKALVDNAPIGQKQAAVDDMLAGTSNSNTVSVF